MILIDTHVLIWLDEGNPKLGEQSRQIIGTFMKNHALHSYLQDNKIQVFKVDFLKIQQIYLTHD